MSQGLKILAIVWGLLLALTSFTLVPDFLANQVGRPLEFRVRSWLGQSPKLDPRLKIYAFDDKTLRYLGYPDLTLKTWERVFTHLGAAKPRAIFIDKLFSVVLKEDALAALPPGQAQNFVQSLQAIGVPVISGGFISAQPVPMALMPLGRREYRVDDHPWPPVEQGYFYGPHPLIRDAFQVGHILNVEYGYAKPFVRLDPVSWIPHAAFLSTGSLRAEDDQLWLDQRRIPLNRQNLIPINFSDRSTYFKQTKSLKFVLDRIEAQEPEPDIKADDIVVLLPAMFTGNADFKDTPVGRLQGGYFNVALMNSVLQETWLRESFALNITLTLLTLALAIIAALWLTPWLATLAVLGLILLVPVLGLAGFTYEGLITTWVWNTAAVALGGIVVLIERLRAENHRSQLLIGTLRGALSPELAASIAQNPAQLQGDPVEQIVTVMFVDIVGFSLTTERLTARESFQQLKSELGFIVEKIHAFNGLVDKSLGDGILAFFGYHFDQGHSVAGHADQALLCAIEIQKTALERSLQSQAAGQPIFPLRIGINTATVYIGNLGTEGRIDFTLIGNGVNFTARLENACAPFRIMLGMSTFDLLGQFSARDPGMSSREILIKHHKKPMRCYEYHALHEQEAALQSVLKHYAAYHQLYDNEPRWHLEPTDYLPVSTPYGEARLANFSNGGVALIFGTRLHPGMALEIHLHQGEGQPPLTMNVQTCWSKVLNPIQVIHGCQFQGSTAADQEKFVLALRDYIQRLGRKAELMSRRRPRTDSPV